MKTMKAIVYKRYGSPDVLQLEQRSIPEPKEGEILIKVHATAVNSGDCRLRRADPALVRLMFGLTKPKKQVLGVVFAGEVVKVGATVTRFSVGDRVFGHTNMNMGAYAEYLCQPETEAIVQQPENLSAVEAASIPFGGTTAWYFLQKAGVSAGQNVLIYGASGSVGTAAVQIAAHFGAEVTGVCSSNNVELVHSLGAKTVIDYTHHDVFQRPERYDIIFDTVNKVPVKHLLKLLNKQGTIILGAAMIKEALQGAWAGLTTKTTVLMGEAKVIAKDMEILKQLSETGKLRAVIDKTYTLEQISEAHRYVEQGHKVGNVAVLIANI